MERNYKNIGLFMVILIPLSLMAFYESYFKYLLSFPDSFTCVVHIHTITALTWIIMLIVQPLFIRKGMMDHHQIMGRLSYIIFPVFVITASLLIADILFSQDARFAAIPAGETFILMLCYGLAIYYRKKTNLHMRFMIGTSIALLGPTLARIVPYFLASWTVLARENLKLLIIQVIIIGLLYIDRKTEARYAYLSMAVLFLVHQVLINSIIS